MQDDFVIVGTAGHIDHGKTTLVRALTGVDTDRLGEEKRRGISIEVGFAPFVLPSGRRVGLVDVPGHERFIRHMLAGVGGVDVALLVVDAREGVMPQTREHLAILDLLRVRSGVVALTKVDGVDDEWLALVRLEVESTLCGSCLAGAPLVTVSARTGRGLDELAAALDAVVAGAVRRPQAGAFRMPVDRVFTIPGAGSVLTGTIWRGEVRVGDALETLPGGAGVRVRSLQTHGDARDRLAAGQRAAIAVGGVRQTLRRGMTVIRPGTLGTTRMADARVRLLPGSGTALAHGQRVRLYLGTSEVLARVHLLEGDALAAGEEGFAQLLLETDLVADSHDPFVLRPLTPGRTIGGGVILDAHPVRAHRRRSAAVVARLLRLEIGTLEERVTEALLVAPAAPPAKLAEAVGIGAGDVESVLRVLREKGELVSLGAPVVHVPSRLLSTWREAGARALASYLDAHPHSLTAPRRVYLQALSALGLDARLSEAVLQMAVDAGEFMRSGAGLALPGRTVTLSAAEETLCRRILQALTQDPFRPPGQVEMEGWSPGQETMVRRALQMMRQFGEIELIEPGLWLSRLALRTAEEAARDLAREGGSFTLAAFRDRLATSRKYAVALLEYFDRRKITRRAGEVREYTGSIPERSETEG